jgi:hypothetical protein
MVKIINPYNANASNGIGASLAQLGQALFGDQVGGDYRRAALFAKEMENQGRSDAANIFAAGGNPDPAALAAAAARAGDPKFFDIQRGYAANAFGATDPRTTNAMVGSGMAYNTTAPAFNRTQDVELEKAQINAQKVYDAAVATANNTPVNVIGPSGPMIMSRADAIRTKAQPVLGLSEAQGSFAQGAINAANMENGPGGIASLKPAEQKFIGALPPTDTQQLGVYSGGSAVFRPDGWYDSQTNVKLPPGVQVGKLQATSSDGFTGSSAVDEKLLNSRTAVDRATAAIDNLTGMLSQENADQSTGYIGRAANLYTDIRSQLEAGIRLVGGETVDQAFNRPEIQQSLNTNIAGMFRDQRFNERARQLGIDNARIQSQVMDLTYMIAKAQDPGGRVSNQDIENATKVVMGSILDPQSGIAVLRDLRTRILQNQQIYETNLARIYPQAAKSMARQPSATMNPATAPQPSQGAQTELPVINGRQAETVIELDGKRFFKVGNDYYPAN